MLNITETSLKPLLTASEGAQEVEERAETGEDISALDPFSH